MGKLPERAANSCQIKKKFEKRRKKVLTNGSLDGIILNRAMKDSLRSTDSTSKNLIKT